MEAIDATAVTMKCCQSKSGGVAPGHWYSQMGYMRDMSGVFRGFISLGHMSEALNMLRFWKSSFDKYGSLHNAECLGTDMIRLNAGNNEIEIPAYFVLNCMFYYEQTRDDSLLIEMADALEWAMETQLPHLFLGMTEFSFDETYIAGGIFPKVLMLQGSAESTLMFMTGGRRLLNWALNKKTFSKESLIRWTKAVEEAEELYRENFVEDGLLYTNQPARQKTAKMPRFMLGFCDVHAQLDGKLVNRWLEPDGKGHFICEECLANDRSLPDEDDSLNRRYLLNSVSLLPIYWESPLFSPEEKRRMAEPGIALFQRTGRVPSDVSGLRSLGYDYGLMLYALVALKNPLASIMFEKILDLLDDTCSWCEYYDQDKPAGCRARPWESGINVMALVAYISNMT